MELKKVVEFGEKAKEIIKCENCLRHSSNRTYQCKKCSRLLCSECLPQLSQIGIDRCIFCQENMEFFASDSGKYGMMCLAMSKMNLGSAKQDLGFLCALEALIRAQSTFIVDGSMNFAKDLGSFSRVIECQRNFTLQVKFISAQEIMVGIIFPNRGPCAWNISLIFLSLHETAVSIGPIQFKMEKGEKESGQNIGIQPIPPFPGPLKIKVVVNVEKASLL